jgi:AhpD family alkylhydroperoxidase
VNRGSNLQLNQSNVIHKNADVFAIWPEGLKAMLAIDQLCNESATKFNLTGLQLELIRLHCSVLNQCSFCIQMHRDKSIGLGLSPTIIDKFFDNTYCDEFTEPERAIFAWASALTKPLNNHLMQTAFSDISTYFSDHEIAFVSYLIAQINSWNRLAIVNGIFALNNSKSPHT